jgi:hypothetical protein
MKNVRAFQVADSLRLFSWFRVGLKLFQERTLNKRRAQTLIQLIQPVLLLTLLFRDNSTLTGYKSGDRSSIRYRDFSVSISAQTEFGVHPAIYFTRTGRSVFRDKADEA